MVKIKILKEGYDFNSGGAIEAEVKKFGDGAHIIVPKKWIGHEVVVFFKEIVRQWGTGYLKAGGNKIKDRKELFEEMDQVVNKERGMKQCLKKK